MKKSIFDSEPLALTNEGGNVLVCFDAEQKVRTTDGDGESGEAGTRVYWEAYAVRVDHPVTYDRLVNAIITASYPADRMQAIVNNHILGDGDEEHEAEFVAMQAWRAKAKAVARTIAGQ